MSQSNLKTAAPSVSIAIFAWNEEDAIAPTLDSLFAQSFFSRLAAQGETAEVICVLNGCTDRTPARAAAVFSRQKQSHPAARAFSCRVEELSEKGKMNAWNQFVHRLSAREARVLIMMDADIRIELPDTLWNMFQVLERDAEAVVSTDLPMKAIAGGPKAGVRAWLSGGMSRMTRAAEAQLCGQLYAIRAGHARRIYVPRDLGACEDGFLKSMVCTDLLAHEVWPPRIRLAPDAAHMFEAYTSVPAVLKNQKRQMIGQTVVHLLVDKHLARLPAAARMDMAAILRARDSSDRDWLKRLILQHLQEVRYFWRLYPGMLNQHVARWRKLPGWKKLPCLPAMAAGLAVGIISGYAAHKSLKAGVISYWPKAKRVGLNQAVPALGGAAQLEPNH